MKTSIKVKTGILLLTPAIVLTLAGCSQPSTPSGGGGSAAGLQLGAVVAVVNDPYFITMKCGAMAAAKKVGATVNWQGPTSADVAKQLQAFNSLIVSQVDGIMATPFSPTAFVQPIKKAMAGGTPIVIMDTEIATPVGLKTVHPTIGNSVTELAHRIAKDIDGKGAISIIAATAGDPTDLERYQALLDVMAKDYPGVTVLPVEYANTDTGIAAKIVNAQLVAHPELKAIYSTNGPEASGVLAALKAAKKTGKVGVYSFDATPVEVAALRAGEIRVLLGQSPYLEGQKAAEILLDYLVKHKGEKNIKPMTPQVMLTPMKLLTSANIDKPSSKPFIYTASCD